MKVGIIFSPILEFISSFSQTIRGLFHYCDSVPIGIIIPHFAIQDVDFINQNGFKAITNYTQDDHVLTFRYCAFQLDVFGNPSGKAYGNIKLFGFIVNCPRSLSDSCSQENTLNPSHHLKSHLFHLTVIFNQLFSP